MKKIVLITMLAVAGTLAMAVDVPNTFSPGTPIKSAEVNANFTALKNAVTTLEGTVASLTTRIEALETKLSKVKDGQFAMPASAGMLFYVQVNSDGGLANSFHSMGYAISVSKSNTEDGLYSIAIGSTGVFDGSLQATAFQAEATCVVLGRDNDPQFPQYYSVKCFDSTGAGVNTAFFMLGVK